MHLMLTYANMAAPAFSTYACLAIACLLMIYVASERLAWRRKYRFPNPVPGVPIFGNSLQVPAIQQGPWAKALAEKHGEM